MILRRILIEKLAWVIFIQDLGLIKRSCWGIKKVFAGLYEVLSDWLSVVLKLSEEFSLFEEIFHTVRYFWAFVRGYCRLDLKGIMEMIIRLWEVIGVFMEWAFELKEGRLEGRDFGWGVHYVWYNKMDGINEDWSV